MMMTLEISLSWTYSLSHSRSRGTFLKGVLIHHNFIKPHMGLDGKTPEEVAGITVEGENKWLTIIQNASRKDSSRCGK
jgi:hypothetical protein